MVYVVYSRGVPTDGSSLSIFFSGHMIARLESIKNLTLSREITTLDASWDRQAVPINSRVASERGLVQIVAAMFPSTLYS